MSNGTLNISLSDENGDSEENERPTADDASSRLYEKLNPVIQLFSDFADPSFNSAIFLERLLDQIKTVMGADLLLLFGWDEGKQEWPLLYHHRLPRRIMKDGAVPRAWQSLPSIVFREESSLFSADISKDPRFIGQVIRGMNLHTFIGTTLRSEQKTCGSLSICCAHPDALEPGDRTAFLMLAKLLIPMLQLQSKPLKTNAIAIEISLDLSGRILSCNLPFENLLGYPLEQIEKTRLSHFLTRSGQATLSESIKKLKADSSDNATSSVKLEVAKQGGRKRTLLSTLKLIKSEARLAGIEIRAENLTDIEPLETELVNKDAVLSILNSLFTSLDHFTNEEEALKEAFEKAFPFLGAEGGMLLKVDERKQKLHLVAQKGLSVDRVKQIEKNGFGSKKHILWTVILEKSPTLLLADSKTGGLETQQVGEDGLLSYMAVPVESTDHLWGGLALFSRSRIFSDTDLKFFGIIAKEIGKAIDHIRLFHRLHQQIKSLKTLNEAGKSLSKSLNLEQILSSTTMSLKNMFGVANCYIFLEDDKRYLLTGASASDPMSYAVRKFEFKMNDDSLVSLTARERHPIRVENAASDSRVGKKWVRTFKSRSLLSVPLINKERVIGVILLDETRYFRKFSEKELEKIVGLADQVSVAIENAILYHSVSRHRERLQTLSSAIVNIQEEEHRRIAKKLRNEAGEAIAAIQKDILLLNESLENPPASTRERLDRMHAKTKETLELLQTLSHDLRPAILDDSGLLSTLKWYIKAFEEQNKTKVHLQTNGTAKRFPARIETLLFRILQEAMANISDHADAESAVVSLEKREPYIHLYITDDGKGFDVKRYFSSPQIIRKGIGILGMKERIELAGGTFYIDSNPGKGTRISIRVPVVRRSSS
ncbi:GAF domain-containing protein [Nitrospira defluvii]|nr:GAF domain-containing protein [Nitrospira defluvii]